MLLKLCAPLQLYWRGVGGEVPDGEEKRIIDSDIIKNNREIRSRAHTKTQGKGFPCMKKILQKLSTLWAFLFYCLCAVGFTWPLTLHLKTHIIGGMGDNIYFVWLVRWYQKAFLEGGGHPFFAPHLNYPQGWNLSTTETSLTSTLDRKSVG